VLATAFISYAFNINLGTLVGGIAFRIRLYGKLGLDAAQIARVIAFALVTNWSGWLLLAGACFAARKVAVPGTVPLAIGALQVIGGVMMALPLAYLAACMFSRKRVWSWRMHKFELPPARLALAQVALSGLHWTLTASIIWTLLAATKLAYLTVLATLLGAA